MRIILAGGIAGFTFAMMQIIVGASAGSSAGFSVVIGVISWGGLKKA
jgi:hypothetical protein